MASPPHNLSTCPSSLESAYHWFMLILVCLTPLSLCDSPSALYAIANWWTLVGTNCLLLTLFSPSLLLLKLWVQCTNSVKSVTAPGSLICTSALKAPTDRWLLKPPRHIRAKCHLGITGDPLRMLSLSLLFTIATTSYQTTCTSL